MAGILHPFLFLWRSVMLRIMGWEITVMASSLVSTINCGTGGAGRVGDGWVGRGQGNERVHDSGWRKDTSALKETCKARLRTCGVSPLLYPPGALEEAHMQPSLGSQEEGQPASVGAWDVNVGGLGDERHPCMQLLRQAACGMERRRLLSVHAGVMRSHSACRCARQVWPAWQGAATGLALTVVAVGGHGSAAQQQHCRGQCRQL